MVLLHFLRWFTKRHPDIDVELLLTKGGDLVDEYRAVCEAFVMPDRKSRPLPRRVLHRLKRNLTGSDAIIENNQPPFNKRYDAVVGNTIATLDHLAWFKRRGGPRTINWVHELEGVIRIYFTPSRLRKVSSAADGFVAASEATRDTLRRLGVSAPIDVVYEFSDLGPLRSTGPTDTRKQLNIPDSAFVVGGCGSIEPRKGLDHFANILKRSREMGEDVYFLWIGGPRADTAREFEKVEALARQLGISDRLIFTGLTNEPGKYFQTIDVFALTSREDPFPLVCLEAASLGKPVICFAGAGGMPEFVGTDAGAVVPLGDVDEFAREIARFKSDRGSLTRAGERAKEKVENEFSMESSCLKLEKLILG